MQDNSEFYKEVYYKELERRNSLNTEIALQGTTVVGIISGMFFLLTNIKSDSAWVHWIFTILVSLETLIAFAVIFYLTRSYYDFIEQGRKYTYLPKMRTIEGYQKRVSKKEFENFMIDSFIEACDNHIEHNDHKSELLTKSSRWMTYLIIVGSAIAFFFVCNYLFDNPNLKNNKNGNQKSGHKTAKTSAANTTVSAQPRQSGSTKTAFARSTGTQRQDTLHKEIKAKFARK